MNMVVVEYPDYEVFPDGTIVSSYSGKPLKPTPNIRGYMYVSLNGRKLYVHRLVAKAFVEGYFPGAEINHKDEDKANNRADNLEWITHERNCNYGTRNKRAGEKHRRPVAAYKDGKEVARFESLSAASKMTGIHISCIGAAATGKKCKTAGGFEWRYLGG